MLSIAWELCRFVGEYSPCGVFPEAQQWLLPGIAKRHAVQELCFVGQHFLLIAGFTATDWSLQPLAELTADPAD